MTTQDRFAAIHAKRRLLNRQLATLEASLSDPANDQPDDAIKAECWAVRQELVLLARREQSLGRNH